MNELEIILNNGDLKSIKNENLKVAYSYFKQRISETEDNISKAVST